MEGKDGGNGKTSPFGNGKGAPASGPSTGGQNFLTSPTSTQSIGGGQDFVTSPKSTQGGSPEDIVKTGGNSSEQKTGEMPDLHADSVPPGGKITKKDPPAGYPAGDVGTLPGGSGRKPFRVS